MGNSVSQQMLEELKKISAAQEKVSAAQEKVSAAQEKVSAALTAAQEKVSAAQEKVSAAQEKISAALTAAQEKISAAQEKVSAAQEKVSAAQEKVSAALTRPNEIGSGTYYSKIEDVWEFEVSESEGAFEKIKSSEKPEFMKAILQTKMKQDYKQLFVEDKQPSSPAQNTIISGEGKNDQTPIRGNGKNGTDPNLSSSSVRTSSSSHGTSTENSTIGGSSVGTGKKGGAENKGSHLFGGPKQSSKAHLFPPNSPVCQDFYPEPITCVFPFSEFEQFNTIAEATSDRTATMVSIRAIADSDVNKLALPDGHASYFDNDMDNGTILVIPIVTVKEAHEWKRNEGYKVLVLADSIKSYRYCDINPLTNVHEANEDDIKTATEFVRACILGLGESLANRSLDRSFEGFKEQYLKLSKKDPEKKKSSAEKFATDFAKKMDRLIMLQNIIKENDNKVLVPKLRLDKTKNNAVRLLKIDFNELPDVRAPHPLLLGLKAGNCLHKFAAKRNAKLYESSKYSAEECQIYADQDRSMLLVPGCPEPDDTSQSDDASSLDSATTSIDGNKKKAIVENDSADQQYLSTPPREIVVPRTITPDSHDKS